MSEDTGGTLTPEIIARALDELWNVPSREMGLTPWPGEDEMSEPVLRLDPDAWTAAQIAEFDQRFWIDSLKRRLRLVTTGEQWIRHTHPAGFRCGEWARMDRVAILEGRTYYCVTFEDGIRDYWDPAAWYEFFPPSRYTGLLDILNGR